MRQGIKDTAWVAIIPLRLRSDATTLLSGEADHFAGSCHLEGVADGETVTITEVESTGYYKVTFTPDAVGVWHVVVTNTTLGMVWEWEVEVSRGSLELLYKAFWNKKTLTRTNDTHYVERLYDDDGSTEIRNQILSRSSSTTEERAANTA